MVPQALVPERTLTFPLPRRAKLNDCHSGEIRLSQTGLSCAKRTFVAQGALSSRVRKCQVQNEVLSGPGVFGPVARPFWLSTFFGAGFHLALGFDFCSSGRDRDLCGRDLRSFPPSHQKRRVVIPSER
jgi:hypothetical protein